MRVYNYTGSVLSGEVALFIQNANGEMVKICDAKMLSDIEINKFKTLLFSLNEIFTETGEYYVTPGVRTKGSDTWTYFYDLIDDYFCVVLDDDLNRTTSFVNGFSNLEVTNVEIAGVTVLGCEQTMKMTFANNTDSEISGVIKMEFGSVNDSTIVYSFQYIAVAIEAHSTTTIVKHFTPTKSYFALRIKRSGETEFIYVQKLIYGSIADEIDVNLQINNIKMSNLYGTRMIGSAVVTNLSEDTYNGEITLCLVYLNEENGAAYGAGDLYWTLTNFESGASKILDFTFDGLKFNTKYSPSFRYLSPFGEIPGGESDWSNPYYMQEGVLCWNKYGSRFGSACSSTFKTTSSHTAVLAVGYAPETITSGNNTNTLYMFDDVDVSSGLTGCNVVIDGVAEEINLVNGYAFYVPEAFTADKVTFTVQYSESELSASDGTNNWQPFTLPFKPTSVTIDGEDAYWTQNGEIGDFWLLEPIAEDDDYGLVFEDVDGVESLRGNQSYMIALPEAMLGKEIVFSAEDVNFLATEDVKNVISTDDFKILGTTYVQGLPYIYMYDDTEGGYVYETGGFVSPFTHYITTSLSDDDKPSFIPVTMKTTSLSNTDDDETTGVCIYNVSTDVADSQMYNLAGQRINPAMTSVNKHGIYISNGRKMLK